MLRGAEDGDAAAGAILRPFQSDSFPTGRAAAGKRDEMATATGMPAATANTLRVQETGGVEEAASAQGSTPALVPVAPAAGREPASEFDGPVARLPVELDVAVPVRDFRVRRLLALTPGDVIASQWCNGEDMPLAAGAVQLAWTEFEVIDTQLAVRVTRLP